MTNLGPILARFVLPFTTLLALSAAVAAAGQGTGAAMAPAEAGARFGQAKSVERFCPGGRALQQVDALAERYTGADRAAFDDAATKTIANWNAALSCQEVDKETGRMNAACRRVKRMSCRQAWVEIGPQGTAMPGLIDLSLENFGREQ